MKHFIILTIILCFSYTAAAQNNPYRPDTPKYNMYQLYLDCAADSCQHLMEQAIAIFDAEEKRTAIIDVPYYYFMSIAAFHDGNKHLARSLAQQGNNLLTRYQNIKEQLIAYPEYARYYDRFWYFDVEKAKKWNDDLIGSMSVDSSSEQCRHCPGFGVQLPSPTTQFELDNSLFKDTLANLSNVNNQLIAALDNCGFKGQTRKYYPIDGGFALVVPIEQLYDDARPLDNRNRWASKLTSPRKLLSFDYLKAVLWGLEGYFRIAMFIVSDEDMNTSGAEISKEEALEWLVHGAFNLPRSLGDDAFTKNHRCEVYIYEFYLTESDKNPQPLKPEEVRNDAQTHLLKTNILQQLED